MAIVDMSGDTATDCVQGNAPGVLAALELAA